MPLSGLSDGRFLVQGRGYSKDVMLSCFLSTVAEYP